MSTHRRGARSGPQQGDKTMTFTFPFIAANLVTAAGFTPCPHSAFETADKVDSSPVVVGDRVFIGCSDGDLYAIDLKEGKKVWSFTAGAPIVASPSIAGGRLVVGDGDGTVHCFQIAKDTLIASAAKAETPKTPGASKTTGEGSER